MDDSNRVKIFFDKIAKQFDAYYLERRKPLVWKFLDFIFRRSISVRFQLTFEECKSFKSIRILDVGCGSGRLAVKLARRGQATVTGVDFSLSMIKIAEETAEEYHVQDRCHFILGDFREMAFKEKFDVSVALGFFDYTKEPQEYLRKMKGLTKEKIIASFPAKWRFRNIIRLIRLTILKCPVYFYTLRQIETIFQDSAFQDYTIKTIGRDYFVVATFS